MGSVIFRPHFSDVNADDPNAAKHYGTKRHSGRYRYGSGKVPYQHESWFRWKSEFDNLRKTKTEAEIARSWGISTVKLRAMNSNATSAILAINTERARKLKEKQWSNVAIARALGVTEGTVRRYLKTDEKVRLDKNRELASVLKEQVDSRGIVMVGSGTNHYFSNDRLGKISPQRLSAAIELLREDGYEMISTKVPQMGTQHETTVKVLAPHGTTEKDVKANKDKIVIPNVYIEDGDKPRQILNPVSVDSKRVQICYADDIRPDGSKGIDRDGMIELRRGVDDISLNKANYAQVRIAVDGTHYLKGMAVYADDLPDGIDIRFNTNKSRDVPMMGDKDHSVLKPLKSGETEVNPFGASIKTDSEMILCQTHYKVKVKDANGVEHEEERQSAINVVSEEGDWTKWAKNLPSQMLSKQSPKVIASQLKMGQDIYDSEFDEIKGLTNPVVKKKELSEFADKCDSAAVDLKAAGLPRQATHVLLSVPSLGENEIFAPRYENDELVVLIRFPHAGRFEITTLTVNNRNEEALRTIGPNALDAVGIHPKSFQRLSGADADGDTAIVIPNKDGKILTMPAIKELVDFEPKLTMRRDPDGQCPRMTKKQTQTEMGKITNLITDMQVKAAPILTDPNPDPKRYSETINDIVHAVKHSMVVIDAEKHDLDWMRSYEENDIASLKRKYQGGEDKGASTLISRASSEERVPYRQRQYNTNKMTGEEYERYLKGEKIWNYTNKKFSSFDKDVAKAHELKDRGYSDEQIAREMGVGVRRAHNLTEKDIWSKKESTIKSTKMYEIDDAHDPRMSSGTYIESLYADYANHMKALGNAARREAMNVKEDIYNPTAAKAYAKEVAELDAQLEIAERNQPLERMAQVRAGVRLNAWKRENPDLAEDRDQVKKKKDQFIKTARESVGAGKKQIEITSKQWEAIQAGAVSATKLKKILNNTKPEDVKRLAMPKDHPVMSTARVQMALSWANQGYTTQQIAEQLGVSVSTVSNVLRDNR